VSVDWLERGRALPGVHVHWEVAPGLPALDTDVQKLGIVLENLVGNAVKFTQRGTIRIRVDYDRAGDRHVFRVTDTGPGIPAKTLANVWEPFQRTAAGTEDGPPGAGIGLAITKRYVDLLGGAIRARSQVGRGTQIEVALPRRAPAGAAAAPCASVAA